MDSRRVVMQSPRDAQAVGIGMIYQDLALFDNLDVASNIFAGRWPVRRRFGINLLDRTKMHSISESHVRRLGADIVSTRLPVAQMSGGQRQMVAAARAIGFDAKVMIMDEPTAALGVRETKNLLDLVSGLKAHGLSVLYVTHRIPDLLTWEIGSWS